MCPKRILLKVNMSLEEIVMMMVIKEDEFVNTPNDYVPTDDENVDDEEFERINEEIYSDVNVELKDSEHEGKEKDDEEMTDAGRMEIEHENINQEVAGDQIKDDAQATVTAAPATQKNEVPLQSSSISSDHATKFLNFNNIPSGDTEIISMMDVKVQHEDPTQATTIPLPIPPFIPLQQQSTLIPTPTTTEATTLTTIVLDSETLSAIHLRVSNLEKEVKELKNVDQSSTLLATIKSKVPNAVNEYLGTSLDDSLYKVHQKHTTDLVKEHFVPADVVEKLKQQYKPQKSVEDIRKIKMEHAEKQQEPKYTIHKALYHALMESILKENQGLKKKKTSKDAEPSKKAKSTESSKGTTKSLPKSTGKSAQAENTVFEAGYTQGPQNLGDDMGNTDEPPVVNVDPKDRFKKPKRPPTPYPKWNEGKTVDNKPTHKWLSDLDKAETSSKTFDDLMSHPIDFNAFVMNRLQISDLTQDILIGPACKILKGTCRSYVELKYNMEECYKALSDQLDWDNPEGDRYPFDMSNPLPLVKLGNRQIVPVDYFFNNDLAYLQGGSTDRTYTTYLTKTKAAKYDLPGIEYTVPNLWSLIKVAYDKHALLGTSHWGPKRQRFYGYASNRVSKHDVYSTKRILAVANVKVNIWYGYGHIKDIEVRRSDQQLYKFMEGDFPRLHLNDIEDMLLLVV
ncbi:hypothetical protein Tco_1445379 [Tanacetum coccineum]